MEMMTALCCMNRYLMNNVGWKMCRFLDPIRRRVKVTSMGKVISMSTNPIRVRKKEKRKRAQTVILTENPNAMKFRSRKMKPKQAQSLFVERCTKSGVLHSFQGHSRYAKRTQSLNLVELGDDT